MSRYRQNSYASPISTLELVIAAEPIRKPALTPQEKQNLSKRVLLLDDDADLRDVVQEYLASYYFQITPVSDGAEGLREVIKDPFDLILCDMMMPKLSGEMFYWAVTRMRRAAGQRFIFITGHQNNPVIQAFFQRIDAVVLVKPFKLDALRGVIEKVLTKVR